MRSVTRVTACCEAQVERPSSNVFGGLDYLVGGDEDLAPGMVGGRQHQHQGDEATVGTGGEVRVNLTGRPPMANNRSESSLISLNRETRYYFAKALPDKRSDTVKEAMVDMQLLCGVWRVHRDEGREFRSAVDSWLREHAVHHTTTGAHDPNAHGLAEGISDSVTLWKRSLWVRREVLCNLDKNQARGRPGLAWRLRSSWNSRPCAGVVSTQWPCRGFLLDGTGGCHTASKSQLSVTTERLRRCS